MHVNLIRGVELYSANGGTLRAKAYDNPVPSLGTGRCNDYEFVTQYNHY